jgi:hypothetical protein
VDRSEYHLKEALSQRMIGDQWDQIQQMAAQNTHCSSVQYYLVLAVVWDALACWQLAQSSFGLLCLS